MALFLIFDGMAYHLYHYHLAGVVWQIVATGVATQGLVVSWLEYTIAALLAIALLCVEIGLAFLMWHWVCAKPKRNGWFVGLGLGASLFLSYTLTLSSSVSPTLNLRAESNDHALIMEAQIIPYFDTVLGWMTHSGIALQTRDNGFFVQNNRMTKPLHYPLHPMHCVVPKKPLNIVMIVLDAWRFDMLNPKVTPHIDQFSKNAWVFTDNFSGGDATQPGIFSLFYSIPANYWTAMLKQHQGPVLIHQLLADHYQMGIFRSASLHYPAFDQTVFREVKNLRMTTPGAESFDRDRHITTDFEHFIANRNPNKPFFSFVFYDETHNYCESSTNYPKPFQPAIQVCDRLLLNNHTNPVPYLNRYRNAAHFDDALVGKVLTTLKDRHLLQNTIVVITADHGEEFNESHQDYWGHASDYTTWQLHTPMVVYWPGQSPKIVPHLTTHYDLVPTIMTKTLGCTNPISDYSVGVPLLTKGKRPFFIANSYIDYAIIKGDRVTRIYPEGNYGIHRLNGQPIPNAELNLQTLKKSFNQINQYFNK